MEIILNHVVTWVLTSRKPFLAIVRGMHHRRENQGAREGHRKPAEGAGGRPGACGPQLLQSPRMEGAHGQRDTGASRR